jgi:hypothetical protein
LGDVQDSATGRIGQFCGDKSLGWIQIILARFVDDPKIAVALRFRVGQHHIDFPALEGYLIAGVIESDK